MDDLGSGTLLDTTQTRYGLDWSFGDRVTITYRDLQLDGMINAVTIRINDQGQETLDARLEMDDIL